MGSSIGPDTAREAQIDAALKALFDALAGQPTPTTFHTLIDQLERQAAHRGVDAADQSPPTSLLRRPLRRQAP